jgi:hypothetical protein
MAMASESKVMCGVERGAVAPEELVVVVEVAVVDDDRAPVAHRVVVVVERRHALGVAADVEDRRAGRVGHGDVLDELAQTHRILVHLDGAIRTVVGVPRRIGAALRDPREQQARERGPLELHTRGDRESGDAAHTLSLPRVAPIKLSPAEG